DKLNLLTASVKMRESLQILDQINGKANLIAFNAAIEGARTRGRLDSFSIVAEQILTQAVRNVELSEKLGQLVRKLHNVALRSTAARYYELSEDLIDKLDRNLFGRNCDVQAWAIFEANIKCLREIATLRAEIDFKKIPPDELHQKLMANDRIKWVRDLLDKVMSVYQVYSDILLVDKEGLIVTSVKRPNLIARQNVSDTDWFKTAIAGGIDVSDMDWDVALKSFVVRYSTPVLDEHKECIGVISTRFNWDYAQEMIDNGNYDDSVQAYIISKQGLVLANTDTSGLGVYREPMNWLDAGKDSMSGYSGYTIETARNGAPIASGYAKTKGYNTYKGKGWTALLLSRLGNIDYEHLLHRVNYNSNTNASKSEDDDFVTTETADMDNDCDKNAKKKIESELVNDELIECMHNINELVDQINTTNHETNMLAINAAIQAGIAGTEGESFGVIAGEIGGLAEKSVAFVSKVNMTTKDLQTAVTSTVAARLSDAARDAADKVDRMLYERYCDIQAWSQMAKFKKATEAGMDLNLQASDLLSKIQKIYEVYNDTFLVDIQGKIIAAATRRELIGQNQASKKWFQEAIQGNVYFSDVYKSNTINGLTMTFAAPIVTWEGKIVGAITSRFNWDYIYDIIDAVIVDSKSQVNLVNSEGILIGSSDREQILEKSYKHLKAFTLLHQGQSGVHNEVDSSDGHEYSVGFCKGKGHNAYPGRGWSVIIRRLSEKVRDSIAIDESENAKDKQETYESKFKKVG
ncbi:MAG: hypothetical protein HQK51_12425, partial [Oligoflexia bacterium]|nr:hypothetical protein [Oligoflexia bacterium]